jgi:hypothetical protein
MNSAIDQDESVGFEISHKESEGVKLLKKKSTVFSVIVCLLLAITAFTAYSYWRYFQTSALPASLKPFLPIHAGELHYTRIPQQYW